MELFFLAILVLLMAFALGSGYPVAFALPGSAIITVVLAALSGYFVTGDMDAYFAQGGPGQWLSAGVTNLRGVYWEVERDTLIAIPLFIFMGIMLQRSKIAEDLLVTMAQLFGPVPGGLGISVVFVGALLAATTGIVGATVVAMGLISLPAMLRNNYSKALATGTIAASGTLGQIIPPSIVLIILADQLASAVDQASTARKALFKESTGNLSMPSSFDVASTSAGEMFMGAFVPGMVLVGLYMLFILAFAFFRPHLAPTVPYEGKYDKNFAINVLVTLVPPLALIFLVLGSIISGIATVNQAGAIGAAGAVIMAGYRLNEGKPRAYTPAAISMLSLVVIGIVLTFFDTNIKSIDTTHDTIGVTIGIIATITLIIGLVWSGWRAFKTEDTLRGVMVETSKTTSLVFIILLGAAMLTAAFRAFGGEELVREFLNSLPGGFWTQFIIVMAVIFILGFFLDFIEIAVVVVPIVAPILLADPSANVTAVWLGVMIGLNIQTSFLTPPFGFALFYLRGVAPAVVRTLDMYKGVIAFICLQLLALGIVGIYPNLVNYLPNRISLTSETAPPPRNPRLQYCVEKYVSEQFAENGNAITKAVADAKALDLSALPKKLARNMSEGITAAEKTFGLLDQANAARQTVNDNADAYRPLHRQVRHIQKKMGKLDRRIEEIEQLASRLHGDANNAKKSALLDRIKSLQDEKAALLKSIPTTWDKVHKDFAKLQKAEQILRRKYRRSSDDAYEPVAQVLAALKDIQALKAAGGEIRALETKMNAMPRDELAAEIKDLRSRLKGIAGTSKLRSYLGKVRSELRAKNPKAEKLKKRLDNVLKNYDAELMWREKAATSLLAPLSAYDAAIRTTIGSRMQERMPKEQALYVAACQAAHRDISLNF